MLGMHSSIQWLIFMWVEALVLQILYKFFPRREWEEESVRGKVVVITGAGSGLGRCVAKGMAQRGAVVVLAVRNLDQGSLTRLELIQETGCSPESICLVELDLSDLSSVRRCVGHLASLFPIIDILINNGGISLNSRRRTYTVEGFEQHMGVNHLSHFLLTKLLLPQLRRADAPRVVTLSSSGLMQSNLTVHDFMCDYSWRGFWFTMPYCNSKMANALFSKELARREGRVKSYALCPGFVKDTQILRGYTGRRFCEAFIKVVGMDLEKGADMVLYCALARETASLSGQLFRFGRKFWSGESLLRDDLAREVWTLSETLVGLTPDAE